VNTVEKQFKVKMYTRYLMPSSMLFTNRGWLTNHIKHVLFTNVAFESESEKLKNMLYTLHVTVYFQRPLS